jgi:hypothetical protein
VAGKAYDTTANIAGGAYGTASGVANKAYNTTASAANTVYDTGARAADGTYETGREGARMSVSVADRAGLSAQEALEDSKRGYEMVSQQRSFFLLLSLFLFLLHSMYT